MGYDKMKREPSTADIRARLLLKEMFKMAPAGPYNDLVERTSRAQYRKAKKLKGLEGIEEQKKVLRKYISAVHSSEISPGETLAILGQLPLLFGAKKLREHLLKSSGEMTKGEVERLSKYIPTAGEPRFYHRLGLDFASYSPRKEYVTAPEWWFRTLISGEGSKNVESAKGLISIPLNVGPEVAAHEMGHASFRTKWPGRLVGKLRTPALLLGIPTALLAPKLTDPDSKLSKAIPAIGALAAAPTLIDEAAASIIGIKGMRAAGLSEDVIRQGKKNLAKAFGTYALATAPLIAAPYVIRKLRERSIEKRQKKGLPTTTDLLQEWKDLKRREQQLKARQR